METPVAFDVLDTFSGVGAFSVGLEAAGMRTVAFCEIESFSRDVLKNRWPGVRIYDDIRDITPALLAADGIFPDVISGGFPCQDVSWAGKRTGLAGANSGLYRELVRTFCLVRPRHGIVENVAGLVDDGLDTVLGDLAESRFDAEWDCVPAKAIGACHERDRVWIITHAQGERRRQGRTGRPPDSFAWIRDAARWNACHAYSEWLEEREGERGNPPEELQAAARAARGDVWQSRWPHEPALLGMDDGLENRAHRTAAIGKSLVPQIPELIGCALIEAAGGQPKRARG